MFDAHLLQQASALQGLALAPEQSVWISANAGTGKTEVLTHRLLALLLSDPSLEPRQLLALTFTKAGAAEMAARLPQRLTKWAMLDDDALVTKIKDELGMDAPADAAARVRALAALVRKAPPLVATIHGLAQQVLGRFALEAGLPADFDVLEDGARKRMLRDIQHTLLVGVDGVLADHLAILLDELGDHGWEELTGIIIGNWSRLETLLRGDGLAGVLARLERELDVDTSGASARPVVPNADQMAALRRVASALPDHAAAAVIKSSEALREEAWTDLLLNTSGKPRKVGGNGALFSKADAALVDEGDIALLLDAAERAEAQLKARRIFRAYDVTRSALVWAAAVRGAYVQRKQAQGLVDYGDLLDGLERVMRFSDSGSAEWVWYGLDRRFRHLVVDEAQDNNPQQDRIVQWLAKSILSGDVGEGKARTVLAVGDMKQSIFRFQGAVPELFVNLRDVLRNWASHVVEVDLVHSFRSGAHVLGLVDKVFEAGDSGAVVVGSDFDVWPAHKAVAVARPSRVEVWDLVEKVKPQDVEPWALPHVRAAAGGHGEDVMCARQAGAWLQERIGKVVMPSTGLPLRWEDVMIVVQRNSVAGLFAGVLRGMDIPVASTGGVVPQAVEDVVAGVRVVFNTTDNLALAQVLKAYRHWNDAQLMALAAKAGVGTLGRGDDAVWFDAVEGDDRTWLEGLAALAWEAPHRVVRRLVAELNTEQAQFEGLLEWAEACANLRELVQRCEQDDLPVVAGGSGIRVLTVHGSKGLQAPLVILADTMRSLADTGQEKIVWGDNLLMRKLAKGISPLNDRLVEHEETRLKADNLRGLYVAMTRAMDWLVVTGYGNVKDSSDTWWTRIKAGMGDATVAGDTFDDVVQPPLPEIVAEGIPDWMVQPLSVPQHGAVQSPAQVRGDMVHALLQGIEIAADAETIAEAERVKNALPWLWAQGARSEMAVVLEDRRVGRIDRLVEHDGDLWVIDFKTGHVPDTLPAPYAAQVRAYVAALRATWPQRRYRAAIVWTATARLDEVGVE